MRVPVSVQNCLESAESASSFVDESSLFQLQPCGTNKLVQSSSEDCFNRGITGMCPHFANSDSLVSASLHVVVNVWILKPCLVSGRWEKPGSGQVHPRFTRVFVLR